ncbi:MAG: hypothetical protein Q9N67_09080 [Ghiorsea sp.]|nr:hypothetical protein [Ghiorsea sp.]
MSHWDKSSRPKRLRKKQKRMIVLLVIIGSLLVVVVTSLWDSFMQEDHAGAIIQFADSVLSDEEKAVIWNGMSDEGKAVILKHRQEGID